MLSLSITVCGILSGHDALTELTPQNSLNEKTNYKIPVDCIDWAISYTCTGNAHLTLRQFD